MNFTEPESKFLNDKHYEVSNLPKIYKSKIIGSAIKCEIIETFEPNNLKLRPIVVSPKCPSRKLS